MSPQLYDCMEVDTHKNDVWGAATILFYLLTENFLLRRPTRLDKNFRLHLQQQLITTDNINVLSETAVDLLNRM